METWRPWFRVTTTDEQGAEAGWLVGGYGSPALDAVDAVGRLMLLARRAGSAIRFSEVIPEVRELLELAGLGAEMQWEPEGGKEKLGLHGGEEDRHLGDLSS